MGWLETNWDKLIIFIFSVVLSGVIGFFSGISAVKRDYCVLSQRVVKNETEISSAIKPQIIVCRENSVKLGKLERKLEELKKEFAMTHRGRFLYSNIQQNHAKTLGNPRN